MYRGINIGSGQPLNTKRFILDTFLGCDFTGSELTADNRRSPDCKNLVWGDNPYIPRTRYGYKPLGDFVIATSYTGGDTIYGIHIFKDDAGEEVLVHAGKYIYRLNYNGEEYELGEQLQIEVSESASSSFMFEERLYIVGCGKYLTYGSFYNPTKLKYENTLKLVSEIAFVPTTVIHRHPNGGGTAYEDINLLTGRQKYSFYVPEVERMHDYTYLGGARTFIIYSSDIRSLSVTVRNYSGTEFTDTVLSENLFWVTDTTLTVDGAVTLATNDKVIIKYLMWDSDGKYQIEKNATINKITVSGEENISFSYSSETGIASFTPAPVGIRGNEGIDNVVIDFTKEATSYSDRINKCSVFDIFGGANDTRIFLSGNPDYKNCDWRSGLYDATYFPDTGYTFVGSSNVAIVGYVKQYDTQMIVKESNQEDGSVFLRTMKYVENEAFFPIEQGATGTGAMNGRTFAYLNGEPMFLSSQGVVGVVGTNVDYRNVIQDRSEMINRRLVREDLTRAFAVELGNKYYLFVNGNIFVADARMRYKDDLGQAQYEWYFWDKANADSATVWGNKLLFGYKGRVYIFKSDKDGSPYTDETGTTERSIEAYWTTPKLYFSTVSEYKTIYDMALFFDKKERVYTNLSAVIDGVDVDLGTFDSRNVLNFKRLNFSQFAFKPLDNEKSEEIKANLRHFAYVKFKIRSVVDNETHGLTFGLVLLQADYIYTR